MINYVNKLILVLTIIIFQHQSVGYTEENKLIIDPNYFNTQTNFQTISYQSSNCLINVEYKDKLLCNPDGIAQRINTLINLRELDFNKIEIRGEFIDIPYQKDVNEIIQESISDSFKKYPKPSHSTTNDEWEALSIKRSIYQLMLAKEQGVVSQFSRITCEGKLQQRNLPIKLGFSIKPEFSQTFVNKISEYAAKHCIK